MSSILSKRKTAYEILEDLRENGVSDEAILDYVVCNNLTEKVAYQLMVETREEFFGDREDAQADSANWDMLNKAMTEAEERYKDRPANS